MTEAPFDPGRILAVLDQHDVEYVLVGGLGASGGTGDQDEAACVAAVQATGFSTTA